MKKWAALLCAFVLPISLAGFSAEHHAEPTTPEIGMQIEREAKREFSWKDFFIYES
jgi:hypothetical protein